MIDHLQQQHDFSGEEQKQNYKNIKQNSQVSRNRKIGLLEKEEMLRVMQSCELIIKQQQQYIRNLQKDNDRKQKIITNLLQRKQKLISNRSQINKQKEITLQNVQELQNKLKQLQNKYQAAFFQKQNKEKQLLIKDKYVKQLSDIVRNQKIKESQLHQQVKLYKTMATQLKEAYEAKISILLSEIRKKVQQDIQKSKLKQINQGEKNSERLKSQTPYSFNQHQLETPIQYKNYSKQQDSQNDQKNSREKTVRNIRKNWPQPFQELNLPLKKDRTILINTPYKESKNSFNNHHKSFSTSAKNSTKKKVNDQNKLLGQMDDVQFMSDSSQKQSQDKSDSYTKIAHYNSENIDTNKEVEGKISIKNIIRQFSKYYQKQNHVQLSIQQIQQTHQKSENEKGKKTKVQQILDKLSLRIKKFEDQNIYDL